MTTTRPSLLPAGTTLVLTLLGPTVGWPETANAPSSRRAPFAAYERQDLAEAERLSLAWLREHPHDAEVTRLLGVVRLALGMQRERRQRPPSEFLPLYRRARESLSKAERLAGGRPLPDLHHALGYILMAEGRFQDAIARLDRAIQETPRNFVLYRLRGTGRLELGAYEEALADLARAVELGGTDLTARLFHAQALSLLGRESDARETLRQYLRLIEKEPPGERHFQALYEVSRYSTLMNDLPGARAALEKARDIDPANLIVRTELGSVYYRLGLPEKAFAELARVLSAPAAPAELRADALHYGGLLAEQKEDHREARRLFEEALALSPTRAETLNRHAAVLRRLGEGEKARAALDRFRQVVEIENDVRRLRTVLFIQPLDRDSRVDLVQRLIELGRGKEALEEIDRLKRSFPEDPAVRELEARTRDAP